MSVLDLTPASVRVGTVAVEVSRAFDRVGVRVSDLLDWSGGVELTWPVHAEVGT